MLVLFSRLGNILIKIKKYEVKTMEMTLREFLKIKSEKIKKAILDVFFREYDKYEVVYDDFE